MRRPALAAAALVAVAAWFPLGGTAHAVFPGAQGRLAFVSDRAGGNIDLYTMNPDGSNPARVTTDPADDTDPKWDPKGRNIIFISTRDGDDADVFEIDDEGGFHQAFTANDDIEDTNASYDLEDDVIIFETDRDGNAEIYTMEDSGRNPKNLTLTLDPFIFEDIDPAVGANGRIAFASDRDGDLEIFSMRLDGSDVKQLTTNDDEETQPSWSPDGSQIAFVSDADGDPDIYVMDADGDNIEQLTGTPGTEAASDLNPAWSPDGSRIAYDTDRDGNREIYIMDPDGANDTRITNNGVQDYEPDWQPVDEDDAFGVDDGFPVKDATDPEDNGSEAEADDADVDAADTGTSSAGSGGAATKVESGSTASPEKTEVIVVREAAGTAALEEPGDRSTLMAVATVTVAVAFAFTVLFSRRPSRT